MPRRSFSDGCRGDERLVPQLPALLRLPLVFIGRGLQRNQYVIATCLEASDRCWRDLGMLAHHLLESLLEGCGVDAVLDQQLDLPDQLLEVGFEIAWAKALLRIVVQALALVIITPMAEGIEGFRQIHISAIDGVQIGDVIDVPGFQPLESEWAESGGRSVFDLELRGG